MGKVIKVNWSGDKTHPAGKYTYSQLAKATGYKHRIIYNQVRGGRTADAVIAELDEMANRKPPFCICGCGKRVKTILSVYATTDCRHRYIVERIKNGGIKPIGHKQCIICGKRMAIYKEQPHTKTNKTCGRECRGAYIISSRAPHKLKEGSWQGLEERSSLQQALNLLKIPSPTKAEYKLG